MSNNNQAGKGDKPRPVVKQTYDANYDNIDWKASKREKPGITKKGKTSYQY